MASQHALHCRKLRETRLFQGNQRRVVSLKPIIKRSIFMVLCLSALKKSGDSEPVFIVSEVSSVRLNADWMREMFVSTADEMYFGAT